MDITTAVIDTGVANTASILAVLRRNGANPFLTNDPEVRVCLVGFWLLCVKLTFTKQR